MSPRRAAAFLGWPFVLFANLILTALPLPAQGGFPARASAHAAGVAEDRIIIRLKPGKDSNLLHRQLGTRARKLLRKAASATTVKSVSFSLFAGSVTWDKAGRNTLTQP